MKVVSLVVVAAVTVLAACGAKETQSESKDFVVIVNPTEAQMEDATIFLSSKHTKGLYPIPGLQRVQYGDCQETWIPSAHGYPTVAIFTPPYKGMVFEFKSQDDLKTFASSAALLGDNAQNIYIGTDANGDDMMVSARVCGVLAN